MHLKQLLEQHAQESEKSVPEWMLGCFKRRCISFANGLSDTDTTVFWLQGRNQTIDLRLPISAELVRQTHWRACDASELARLANYEGWCADSLWQDDLLSWSGGVSFQLHNRWPEPAKLSRVGNCMMEFAPSGAYVEDWRLQSCQPGPLISLRLLEERDMNNGELRHQRGALIITGNWAGLVLGRAQALPTDDSRQTLPERLSLAEEDPVYKAQVFNFECSIAQGSLDEGFTTCFSTQFSRVGQPIFSLQDFRLDQQSNQLVQQLSLGTKRIERRFAIDSLEQHMTFTPASPWPPETETWFEREYATLGRYLQSLD